MSQVKHKALFISYDGLTDPLGQSQILPYLIGLSALGHKIYVLSAEKKEAYAKRKATITAIVQKNNITWHSIFYTKRPPIFSTVNDLYRLFQRAKQLIIQEKLTLIHCRSYLSAILGEKLSRKYRLPWIFDMRGFWADERVDGNLWNLKNPLYSAIYAWFKFKEKQWIQTATRTVVLTFAAKQEIESWSQSPTAPVQVVPCCVDTTLFTSANTEKLVRKPFTLLYLGSVGTWYLVHEMLLFFKQLLQKYPDAQFHWITPESPTVLLGRITDLGLPTSHFLIKSVERVEVPLEIERADVCIFFIRPAYSKIGSSATKMGEILATGKPIIANAHVGDHDYLFANYPCGLLLPELSQDSYEYAVSQIPNLLNIEPNRLRTVALDYFSLEKGINLYNQLYQSIALDKQT